MDWETLFDAVPERVMILDRDKRIVQANTATAAFLGVSCEQLEGRRCHCALHGTERPVQGCPFADAVASGRPAKREVQDPRSDTWQEITIVPILDQLGEPCQFLHTARDITEQRRSQIALEETQSKIRDLRHRLDCDDQGLSGELRPTRANAIVGQSPAMLKVLRRAERVAKTHSTVLISGETGTGKELIASAIHQLSPRSGQVMYRVNCAAMSPTLIESELFGREKGAYTGALTRQVGRFELANGSTLLLDELGELPLDLQAKLLRVLETGTFERVGSPQTIHVDVRIIAASNRELEREASEGKFRSDLFYRLNVFPIHLPPLREHPEDIQPLVWSFIDEFSQAMGKVIESVPRAVMEALERYAWPGNIRELRNVIERAMILCDEPTLCVELPAPCAPPAMRRGTLAALEHQRIIEVLEETNWRIRGPQGAANRLGLKPTTLESRMAKLGIHCRRTLRAAPA